ncbi:MAG TPA: thiamine pyrophosphate-dependent enzyme, partial [Streptosporangiaceae bacterium]
FLELRTYRFRAHSMYDPDLYRDKAEIERWKKRDPIEALAGLMSEAGELPAGDLAAMDEELTAAIGAAVVAARSAPAEDVKDLEKFVYTPRQP